MSSPGALIGSVRDAEVVASDGFIGETDLGLCADPTLAPQGVSFRMQLWLPALEARILWRTIAYLQHGGNQGNRYRERYQH